MEKPRKKENTVEGILFLASVVLLIVTGFLYLKREDNDYIKLRKEFNEVKALVFEVHETKANLIDVLTKEGMLNKVISSLKTELNERIDLVDDKLEKNQVIEVVIREPIKVLSKQVQPKPKTLPGLTPQLKKQVREMSQ